MIDLSGIISISGMPGLYKVVAQAKSGLIVEGLNDKKRIPVYASHKVSSLEDISMFTTGDDKPIAEILKSIYDKENGKAAIDGKASDKEVEAYFSSILPDYDKERVYVSNMRKLFAWYNVLQASDNLKVKTEGEETASEEKGKEKTAKASGEEKPKKATAKTAKPKTTSAKPTAGVKKTASVRKTGSA